MALEIASALVRFIQFKVICLLSTRYRVCNIPLPNTLPTRKSSLEIVLSLQIGCDFGEWSEREKRHRTRRDRESRG